MKLLLGDLIMYEIGSTVVSSMSSTSGSLTIRGAYLVHASLYSLYLPLQCLPVLEKKRRSRISAAPIKGGIK